MCVTLNITSEKGGNTLMEARKYAVNDNQKYILMDCSNGSSSKIEQADHWRIPLPMNKVPRVLITPMRPCWANDRDVARFQAKTVPKNLIWSESVPRLRSSSSSVRKIPGALPSRPWACPLCPHAQITIPWHIYRTKTVPGNLIRIKSAQWLLSSASERFQKPLPCHGHAHYTPMGKWPWRCILQANTVPMNLILNKSAQ